MSIDLLACAVGNAAAAGRPGVSGAWGSVIDRLAAQGVNFEAVFTGDVFSNLHGGAKTGTTALDNVDLLFTMDGEKLLGQRGLTLFVYGLGDQGGSPSKYVGDLQTLDNIDAPNTWKIFEAWADQSFCKDRCSIRFGLYNLNSEFDTLDTAALFINSAEGVGPEFSQTGQNGPSIFPTTSLALRLAYQSVEGAYLRVALLDGVPGDPGNPHGTHIRLGSGDGALLVTELGRRIQGASDNALGGHYGVGVWHYTAHFDDLTATDENGQAIRHRGNDGIYLLAERTLYRESKDPDQGLAAYCRYGRADADINTLRDFFGAGLVYTGALHGRPADQLGLAVADARTGSKYRAVMTAAGTPAEAEEIAVELSYKAQLREWLSLQPDLQYIIHPGADTSLSDALALSVRMQLRI